MRFSLNPILAKAGKSIRQRIFSIKNAVAILCLVLGSACLWAALDLPGPMTGVASAVSTGTAQASLSQKAEQEAIRHMLLQATVDSAAFSLGGSLAGVADPDERRRILSRTLDALTFQLGAPVYFTAWENTLLLHSPLTPDTSDLDFVDALDGRGQSFVRALADAGRAGNGFIQVVLPPMNLQERPESGGQEPGSDPASACLPGNDAQGQAVVVPGLTAFADVSPLERKAADRVQAVDEIQVIYTKTIPGSDWHLSAFMGSPDKEFGLLDMHGDASSAWESFLLRDRTATQDARKNLRLGLCLSGFSLLGFAGICLAPRRRTRPADEACL